MSARYHVVVRDAVGRVEDPTVVKVRGETARQRSIRERRLARDLDRLIWSETFRHPWVRWTYEMAKNIRTRAERVR